MMLSLDEIAVLRADSYWNEGFFNLNNYKRGKKLLSATFLF
jgi:hypothetical protein